MRVIRVTERLTIMYRFVALEMFASFPGPSFELRHLPCEYRKYVRLFDTVVHVQVFV